VAAVCRSTTAQVQVPRITALPNQNKQMVSKPRILTQLQKIQVAQKILSGTGQKVSSLESPIVLDLFHLFVKDRAYLNFYEPSRISPEINLVYFPPSTSADQSYVEANFINLSPGTYLIDVSVNAAQSSTIFTLRTPGAFEMKMPTELDNQHLFSVVIVKPGNANSVVTLIVSASRLWNFYSCEISRVQ
jgi:hypothetical protein